VEMSNYRRHKEFFTGEFGLLDAVEATNDILKNFMTIFQ
jgi:hypothetical protein